MNEADIASRRNIAWRAWLAGYMRALNKQLIALHMPKLSFTDLSADGQQEISKEFEEWWHPLG